MTNYFDQYNLHTISNLNLLANQVVEGFIIGLHKSPFHGFSVEFAEHRLYNNGESVKDIDWKVYARTDRLYVKKFEEETNLRCQILIDISSSMNFPFVQKAKTKGIPNKVEFATLAAASLMNLLRKQRDAFGLTLYDDKIRVHTVEKANIRHYQYCLNYLDQVIENQDKGKESCTAEVLHEVADRIHKRSMVVIFSDAFQRLEDKNNLIDALQHLKFNKHEVIFFHVLDRPLEQEFQFENRPYIFEDLESGERIKLSGNELKDSYTKKFMEFTDDIYQACLQNKIDYVPSYIQDGFGPVLNNYLIKRSKMYI